MKIDVIIMNPAGNITALVKQPLNERQRVLLSEQLMQSEDSRIEQVGFITEPRFGGSIRVEMMGQEFCGNALRCAGLYHIYEQGILGQAIVPVEISGCDQPVAVGVNTVTMEARANMPIPKRYYQALIEDISAYVCDFGGIVHFVLPEEYPEEEIIDQLLQYAVLNFDTQAIGLIFTSMETNMIWPVVFVPATGSLVFENSCASGTVAVSVYSASLQKGERFHMDWKQPGGCLHVELKKADGKIESIALSSPISRGKTMTVEFDEDNIKSKTGEIRYINENGNNTSEE